MGQAHYSNTGLCGSSTHPSIRAAKRRNKGRIILAVPTHGCGAGHLYSSSFPSCSSRWILYPWADVDVDGKQQGGAAPLGCQAVDDERRVSAHQGKQEVYRVGISSLEIGRGGASPLAPSPAGCPPRGKRRPLTWERHGLYIGTSRQLG